MAELLLLVQLATTLFMVGLIWFVQVVHYPLFDRVGRSGFQAYSEAHSRLTTRVVGPPMLLEAFTAGALIFIRPAAVPAFLVWVGAGLLALVWLSTIYLQVPHHSRLGLGFDANAHGGLVLSNWVRTVAWSGRALVVLWMAALAMP
ncbi:MAG: hypothetical protein ACFB50_07410 [Rubrobacteraceae bacterium]